MNEYIRQSNLIEGVDDPKEDKQSMNAWNYLKKQKTLTHDVVCKVQKMITINQPIAPNQRGYYRNISTMNVRVGGRICPDHSDVWRLMDAWMLDMQPASSPSLANNRDNPIAMHIRLEKIHPFCDGNGRSGRMILWWHQLKLGEKPTLFKADEREDYYKLFRE